MTPTLIPFTPGDNNDTIGTSIDNVRYLFAHHWNPRDAAHYFDIYQADLTSIILGVKVVLGTNLGKVSTHPFFKSYILRALDTSGQGLDAGQNDLGDRVVVTLIKLADLGVT